MKDENYKFFTGGKSNVLAVRSARKNLDSVLDDIKSGDIQESFRFQHGTSDYFREMVFHKASDLRDSGKFPLDRKTFHVGRALDNQMMWSDAPKAFSSRHIYVERPPYHLGVISIGVKGNRGIISCAEIDYARNKILVDSSFLNTANYDRIKDVIVVASMVYSDNVRG